MLGEIVYIKILEEDVFLAEPVGKQPKYWFESYKNRYLFKFATNKADGTPIYNDVSECMAHEVARFIGVPVAEYYLCENNGQKGVITKDFLNNDIGRPKKEEFFDGVYLISQIDPGFKNTSLINPKTKQYYTVDLVLRSVEKYGLMRDVLNMLVYDALIANRDRNPSNYGVIVNHETGNVRFAPLYDNCTSLGISMVSHRLDKCFDSNGNIIDNEHLNTVIHKHFVGKITLERFSQYQDKRVWDRQEEKRILSLIEEKRIELLSLVNSGKLSITDYHKELYKIGNLYRKFDVSTVQYQTLIAYLTLNYPNEIEEIMGNICKINEEVLDKIFNYYKSDIPIDRMNMAKQIILRRGIWMTDYYYKYRSESRGKLNGR